MNNLHPGEQRPFEVAGRRYLAVCTAPDTLTISDAAPHPANQQTNTYGALIYVKPLGRRLGYYLVPTKRGNLQIEGWTNAVQTLVAEYWAAQATAQTPVVVTEPAPPPGTGVFRVPSAPAAPAPATFTSVVTTTTTTTPAPPTPDAPVTLEPKVKLWTCSACGAVNHQRLVNDEWRRENKYTWRHHAPARHALDAPAVIQGYTREELDRAVLGPPDRPALAETPNERMARLRALPHGMVVEDRVVRDQWQSADEWANLHGITRVQVWGLLKDERIWALKTLVERKGKGKTQAEWRIPPDTRLPPGYKPRSKKPAPAPAPVAAPPPEPAPEPAPAPAPAQPTHYPRTQVPAVPRDQVPADWLEITAVAERWNRPWHQVRNLVYTGKLAGQKVLRQSGAGRPGGPDYWLVDPAACTARWGPPVNQIDGQGTATGPATQDPISIPPAPAAEAVLAQAVTLVDRMSRQVADLLTVCERLADRIVDLERDVTTLEQDRAAPPAAPAPSRWERLLWGPRP